MGGAKFLGRDYGMTLTDVESALGFFVFWLVGGLIISFVITFIFFPEPNITFPVLFYFGVGIFLLGRYLRIDKKDEGIK